VVISNGILSITLANPGGYVLGISYSGMENVLEAGNKDDDRGYLFLIK
jgi:rhamnogalacturonan endolyase